MTRTFTTFFIYLTLFLIAPMPALASDNNGSVDTEPLLIRGGWLFDGISDARRRNSGILVEGGNIIGVDLPSNIPSTMPVQVIELAESETILPGLIDLHAHYNLDLIDQGRAEEVVYNGIVFLANGVTATWSAGEFFPERMIAQRDLIEAGRAVGPHLFVSGPYFGAFRCEYNVSVAEDECAAWPNDITEKEIIDEVSKWAQEGVVSLKIKQATPNEARIIIEQAHKLGMTTTGHLANYNVEYDVSTRDAILMGMDRIEHQLTLALGQDDPRSTQMNEMVDLMIKHQVYYGPNLQMYGGINLRNAHPTEMTWTDESKYFTPYTQTRLLQRGIPSPESEQKEYDQRIIELMALYDAGGKHLIVVGTDEPVYTNMLPGFAYHRELLAMTYAGLPPIDVLKAATINGAMALGVADRLGSLESGKSADLLVVKGNPLDDIKAARNIRFVMKAGQIHNPEELLRLAEGKIGPAGPADHRDWTFQVKPLRD
jgi:imidazolonepropionase-like amidohydrolase